MRSRTTTTAVASTARDKKDGSERERERFGERERDSEREREIRRESERRMSKRVLGSGLFLDVRPSSKGACSRRCSPYPRQQQQQ